MDATGAFLLRHWGNLGAMTDIAARKSQNLLHKCLVFEHSACSNPSAIALYSVGADFGAVTFIATK